MHMTETVYVSSNQWSGKYHTDKDCYILETIEYREESLHLLPGRYEECKVCSGEYERVRVEGPKLSTVLEQLDPDELDF